MHQCNMKSTSDHSKRVKMRDDQDRYCLHTLHDVCNWFQLEKPAIEYHDLEEIIVINYNELKVAKETVINCLRHIQYPEFIGINFDILEYCVPALMLGILDSGNAFFNVPSNQLTYKEICASLYVKYIFTKCVTSDREVICQFNIHGQSIYLMKLTGTQDSIIDIKNWYNFAYAIATSGSTGTPKVVKVPHCCILPNIMNLRKILDVSNLDKISQLTNFTFDPSIIEIFLSLTCAATLFMVSKTLRNEAARLLEKMVLSRITILQITPSLLFHKWSIKHLKRTILNEGSSLRVLLLGGEPFPNIKLLLEASHPQNMTRLFNIYGITEVSCWSSLNEIVKDDGIDESYVGEPLSETIFQIRDEDNKVVTKGEGILYIGSSSRICIIGNEIENLNKPVFRNTGDIVSIDEDGKIFYRGRCNNIIKRFGNKVNLRELERIVTKLNFIRNCVALWDADNHKLYLCLSTTKSEEESLDVKNDVLSHLEILSAIYKPDKMVIVKHFDFTTSGKICLASLRKLCKETETKIINANDLHLNVKEIFGNIWNQHIKTKDTGFVISGGTSITALQISNVTVEVFKMEFPELIGMLLRDVTFNECIHYIRNTLNNKNWKNSAYCCTNFSKNTPAREILNADRFVTKTSSNHFSISVNKNDSYRWCKCRGRIYGDIVMQKQDNKEKIETLEISNIEVLANYNLQKCVDASPSIYCYSEADLFATVGSHSGIICTINLLETNSKSYEVKLPDRIEASVLITTGFRGIVGCYDGYIYCIHLKTGEIIWKYQTQDMVKCTAITCMQRSKIFVGSYDHHIYCLSIDDGAEIWKTKASQAGICATGCLHSQSVSVLFGTLDGSCVALEQSSGQITWKRKLSDPIFVAPVVLQTGHALFCSVTGTLCCFDIETNCQMWRYEILGNVFSYPVIFQNSTDNEHIILASHNKNLYCLEMPRTIMEEREPKLRYTLQLHSPIFATSWCENGYTFVACTDGTLQVYDLWKGKLLASSRLPGEIFSSPVVHDNLVIMGCRDNNLYVLKLS